VALTASLLLLAAAAARAARPALLSVAVRRHELNATFCGAGGVVQDAELVAAVIEARFDQPLFFRRAGQDIVAAALAGASDPSAVAAQMLPLSECQRVVGLVGGLELAHVVVPLSYERDATALFLPRHSPFFDPRTLGSPARQAALPAMMRAVPVCNYEDAELAEWLALFGFPPQAARALDPRVLAFVVPLRFSEPVSRGVGARRGREHTVLELASLADATLVLHGAANTATGRVFNLTNARGESAEGRFALRGRLRVEPRPDAAAVFACSDATHRPEDGAAARAQRERLDERRRLEVNATVLLEETVSLGLPFVSKLFKAVFGPVLEPTVNQFVQQTTAHVLEPVGQVVSSEANVKVPQHVSVMLSETVPFNVTNILVDTVTDGVTRAVTRSLDQTLTPALVQHVPPLVSPSVSKNMRELLPKSVPQLLQRGTPSTLQRALTHRLLESLVMGITHAVTAALSGSLVPSNANTDHYCHNCYFFGQHCTLCHFSPDSMYYVSYHAAYYSDYYARYYTEFYGEAAAAVDRAMYPPGEAGLRNEQEGILDHEALMTR
jgi:hypothetical protein